MTSASLEPFFSSSSGIPRIVFRSFSMRPSFCFKTLSCAMSSDFSISASRALAGVSMRISTTWSTNSSKERALSSRSPCFPSRLLSDSPMAFFFGAKSCCCIWLRRSSIMFSSTPSLIRLCCTFTLERIFAHSSSLILPSWDSSVAMKASVRQVRSSCSFRASSSSRELSSMTWHRTPINMLRRVIPDMTMKAMKSHMRAMLSF
mmetsp:Transcript_37993/g.61227  ORF Transcript_37993/g.61227 Transcript_37993/m.61227 type:complete len:204 (+) Transcript_37993:576-1187(+)